MHNKIYIVPCMNEMSQVHLGRYFRIFLVLAKLDLKLIISDDSSHQCVINYESYQYEIRIRHRDLYKFDK